MREQLNATKASNNVKDDNCANGWEGLIRAMRTAGSVSHIRGTIIGPAGRAEHQGRVERRHDAAELQLVRVCGPRCRGQLHRGLAGPQTSDGTTGSIGSGPGVTQITMIDATASYPLDRVLGLSRSGARFRTLWLNSY